jgi:hypothetical protein
MFVQSIQHAMSDTPKKEKAGYKYKWNKETLGNKFLTVLGRGKFVCHIQY